MYLINLFKKYGISLFSGAISLFTLLGIFTYANAEVICDNCQMNVEFKGVYQEDTCAISVNGASANETVVLPTISYKTLSSPGKEAGATLFTVALNDCPTDVEVNLFFKSFAGNLNPVTENLTNKTDAGFAQNVELKLRDASSKHIAIDNPASMQLYDIPNVNSSVSKNYYVSYYAGENPVSPGNVEAKTVLEVVYK
ncbi:fimbrial protein [Morganella morganii]|nr:type 1 fimbrial protein [Morganella morganii]